VHFFVYLFDIIYRLFFYSTFQSAIWYQLPAIYFTHILVKIEILINLEGDYYILN